MVLIVIVILANSVVHKAISHEHISASDYRTDVPPVLDRARSPDKNLQRSKVINDFKRAYAAENRPRIVVFWNREISDQVSSSSYRSQSESMFLGDDLVRVREQFISSLLSSDMTIVSRALATRKAAAQQDSRSGSNRYIWLNGQTMETVGIEKLADVVVEVRQYVDTQNSLFRIQVIDVATGSIRKRFNFDATTVVGELVQITTDHGYSYIQRQVSPEEIGDEMALKLMKLYTE